MNPLSADQLSNESDRSDPSERWPSAAVEAVGDVGSAGFFSFSNGLRFARGKLYDEEVEAVDIGEAYVELDDDGLVAEEDPGKTRSGTNVVWHVVNPPPVAPQNLGDMALRAAAVEPDTSFRGL